MKNNSAFCILHYALFIARQSGKLKFGDNIAARRVFLRAADFMGLQLGDVIRLNTKVDSDMDIVVGNIRKFTALPGASEDAYAGRVTSVIREEE